MILIHYIMVGCCKRKRIDGNDDLTTGDVSVTNIAAGDGTALLPSYSFTTDPDTGIYKAGSNLLGFSTGGEQAATLSSSGGLTIPYMGASAQITVEDSLGDGSLEIFQDEGNNAAIIRNTVPGKYLYLKTDSTNNNGVVIAPTEGQNTTSLMDFLGSSDGSTYAVKARVSTHTDYGQFVAARDISDPGVTYTPVYTFYGDTDTGIGSDSSNTINLICEGNSEVTISPSEVAIPSNNLVVTSGRIFTSPGTFSLPGYSFGGGYTTTGLYTDGSTIGFTIQGASAGTLGSSGLSLPYLFGDPQISLYGTLGSTRMFIDSNNDFNIQTYSLSNKVKITAKTIELPPGSAAGPSYGFSNGYSGMYSPSENELAFACDSAQRMLITATSVTIPTNNLSLTAGKFQAPLGTTTVPSYSFNGDSNTGIYSPDADQVAISCNDTQEMLVTTTSVTIPTNDLSLTAGKFQAPLGTSSLPSYSFNGDSNTGIYSPDADQVAISCNDTQEMLVTTTSVTIPTNDLSLTAGKFQAPLGTSSLPSYSFNGDPNTGMYSPSTGKISLSCSTVEVANFTSTQTLLYNKNLVLGLTDTTTKQIYFSNGDGLNTVNYMFSRFTDGNTRVQLGFEYKYTTRPTEVVNPVSNTTSYSKITLVKNNQIGEEISDAGKVNLIEFNDLGSVLASPGTVSLCAYSFLDDPDTGMYWVSPNVLGFAAGGLAATMSATNGIVLPYMSGTKGIGFTRSSGGAVANMYVDSSNDINITNGSGGSQIILESNGFGAYSNCVIQNHTSTNNQGKRLSINGSDDTIYREVMSVITSTVTTGLSSLGQIQMSIVNPVGTPAYSFLTDTATGMYRAAANVLGFSSGGAQAATMSGTAGITIPYMGGTSQINFIRSSAVTDSGGKIFVDSSNDFNIASQSDGARLKLVSNYGTTTGGVLVQSNSATLNSSQAFTINGSDGAAYQSALNVSTSTTSAQVTVRRDTSLAAPTYSFIDDPDTGLSSSGADTLDFLTGSSSSRLKITTAAITASLPTTVASIVDASNSAVGGALTVSGGLAVAKKLYVGTGVYLPTTGGTAAVLNHHSYTQYSVADTTSGQSVILNINVTRLGSVVTITGGCAGTFTFSGSPTVLTWTNILAAEYSSVTYTLRTSCVNGNDLSYAVVIISGRTITIERDLYTSPFANAIHSFSPFTISYNYT